MSSMLQGMYQNRVKIFFFKNFILRTRKCWKFTILTFPTLDFLIILQDKNSGNFWNDFVVLYPIFINYYPGMYQKVSFLVAIANFFSWNLSSLYQGLKVSLTVRKIVAYFLYWNLHFYLFLLTLRNALDVIIS